LLPSTPSPKWRNRLPKHLRNCLLGLITFGLLWQATPAAAGNVWFKVAGGISGLAMDDINDGDFRFYDDTESGYNLPELTNGFSLSFHMGSKINRDWAMGFSWDIQHAHTSGTDVDVKADLKLDANIFMGHFYWTPLQGKKMSAGLAAGMGFVAAGGTVDITRGSTNFGEGKSSGTSLAFELMSVFEYALGKNKGLQLTAGWRDATVDKVKFEGRTATNEDGSDLKLDYSGYTLKLGVIWRFGE
jgi:hypothetical protein